MTLYAISNYKQSEWQVKKWVSYEWPPFEGKRSSSEVGIFCDLRSRDTTLIVGIYCHVQVKTIQYLEDAPRGPQEPLNEIMVQTWRLQDWNRSPSEP
jgi:hypothetical protein